MGGSFDPSTPVQTYHGLVPIRDIKIGDLILSANEATGATAWRRVEDIFGTTHDNSIALGVSLDHGESENITTTEDHPFWVAGRGWTSAGAITVGSRLRDSNGWNLVSSVQYVRGKIQTYNLTVTGLHTFFVGKSAVWVHNGCYDRPSGFRKNVEEDVWDANIEPETGQVRDSKTGRFMAKDKPWDMGHKDQFKFSKHQESAETRKITRKQFLDEHNDVRRSGRSFRLLIEGMASKTRIPRMEVPKSGKIANDLQCASVIDFGEICYHVGTQPVSFLEPRLKRWL